jgi:hypothetical protein
MRSSTKAKLRALRARMLEEEPAQSEGERELELAKNGVLDDAPLERDDPPEERSHWRVPR